MGPFRGFARDTAGPNEARTVAILLLAGLVLRLGAFLLVEPSEPSYDEAQYFGQAAALTAGRPDVLGGRRAPGSIWFFSAAFDVFGTRPSVARLANVLVSALVPWITWRLGRRFVGTRAALLAAAGAAVYPNLVLFGASILSEGLYVPLAVGALAAVAAARESPRAWIAAAAGALLGAATLTREVGALFAPAAALWLLAGGPFPRGRRFAGAALYLVGFAVVVVPWSVRQSAQVGSFILVSQTTGMNLLVGNVPPPDDPARKHRGASPDYQVYRRLGKTLTERETAAQSIAFAAIRDRLPWWPVEKVAETLPDLLSATSLPVARLRLRPSERGLGRRAFETRVDGTPAEGLRDVLAFAAAGAWVVLLPAAAAGVALGWGRPGFALFALFIAAHVAPVVATFGSARFRLPFVPVLLIAAAWLVVHGAASWRTAGPVRRAIAVGLALVLAGTSLSDWGAVLSPHWTWPVLIGGLP